MTVLLPDDPSLFGSGLVARRVDGRRMRTVSGVFDELARAWAFPDYFGRNKDALDDCMRDLPTGLFTAEGSPATGYATIVEHVDDLLADAPDELAWFAESIGFWTDHYPDGEFLFVLVADDTAAVRVRWAQADAVLAVPAEED